MPAGKPITILIAEDDSDDCFLIHMAFVDSHIDGQLRFVNNGDQLLDYLLQQGEYAEESSSPRPDIVVIDLNMPVRDGREALWEIKQNPVLCHLPVVVLTTSSSPQDQEYCSDLRVSAYIVKPNSYTGLLGVINDVIRVYQKKS